MIQFKIPKAARFVTKDSYGWVQFWEIKPTKGRDCFFVPLGHRYMSMNSASFFTGIRKMQCIELKPKTKGKKR